MSDDLLGKLFPGYSRIDGDQGHGSSEEKKRTIEPCNPLKRENFGIAMAYFFIEFIFSVIDTPLNVYMVKTLNAEPEMQSTIGILQTLPWSFKLLFGFISDFYPIYNMRRISYLIIGIIVYSGSLLSYTVVGIDSVVFLSVCMFVATLGLIQIDVVADAMCVERSKFESEDEKGRMQAACYSIRFAGGLVGAVIGATVCNKERWGWGLTFHQMTLLNGVAPFIIIAPWLPWLREKFTNEEIREFRASQSQQQQEILTCASLDSVESQRSLRREEDIQLYRSRRHGSDLGDAFTFPMHETPAMGSAHLQHDTVLHHHLQYIRDRNSQRSNESDGNGPGRARTFSPSLLTHKQLKVEGDNNNISGNGNSRKRRSGRSSDNGSARNSARNSTQSSGKGTIDREPSSAASSSAAVNQHTPLTESGIQLSSYSSSGTTASSDAALEDMKNKGFDGNGEEKDGIVAAMSQHEDVDNFDDEHDEEDDDEDKPVNISEQLNEIWETVQLKAVWRPMAFVYIYNILQIPNVAWQSFLQLTLHFEPWLLGLTVLLGSFMTWIGIMAYERWFIRSTWRGVYLWSMVCTTFFSLLQLVLIFQINKTYLHISNYFFSLGDDIIVAFVAGVQFLPVGIMYMSLCPEGAEGSSYSMLTTFGNVALVCASNIGNSLAGVWDVSNDALRAHNISGLWRLSLLTSSIALLPMFFLWLLPGNSDEQSTLAKSKEKSKVGGAVFLTVFFGSLMWTVYQSVMQINSAYSR